jgi:phage terminase large subunit-like protein
VSDTGPRTQLAGGASRRPTAGRKTDAVMALMMAVVRAEMKPEPVRLLGWF